MSTPLAIKFYDLVSAARAGKLTAVVERDTELNRLVRIMLRPTHHHAVLVADAGSGKTSLTETLALHLHQGKYSPLQPKMYRLNTEPIKSLLVGGDNMRQCLTAITEATSQLTGAIIVVEDIQLLAADDPNRLELTLALLQALASRPDIRLIATTTASAYHHTFAGDYVFGRLFDALEFAPASDAALVHMVEQAVPRLEAAGHQRIEQATIEQAIVYGGRFGRGRSNPDAAIRLLEEACVKADLDGYDTVTLADLQAVVAERERLPISDLEGGNHDHIAELEPELLRAVVGQDSPLRTIARTVAKAQLGLGDTTKPRGSFLLLGPSGVGKTETAKALTRLVYSGPQALIRLDMSEYSEPHAAVRLIGSPPGYVGYEEGGQLTGAVMREPYSLVLLDEIEKAHPKLFDLFLQLLDDGRLTDSTGKTVDFTETMVLATSNLGAREIAAAAADGIDVHAPEFLQNTLLPLLMQTLRPEFINRFDAILVYEPLGELQLVALAQRELVKLGERLSRLGVQFDVPDDTLAGMLRPFYNPLFGARPVKRLIATHFETPLADKLIRRELNGPIIITGQEAWLYQGASS